MKVNDKKRILKIRSYNMANFSGGSNELYTYSLYSIIPATVIQIVIWILYIMSTVKHKDNNAKDFFSDAHFIGTVMCFFIGLGGFLLYFLAAFGYFNLFWAFVVFYLCAINPATACFISLGLGRRYARKHPSDSFTKSLLVIISSFVGVVLLGELLLCFVIEFCS